MLRPLQPLKSLTREEFDALFDFPEKEESPPKDSLTEGHETRSFSVVSSFDVFLDSNNESSEDEFDDSSLRFPFGKFFEDIHFFF